MKDLLLALRGAAEREAVNDWYGDEAVEYVSAFEAEAGALAHRDGWLVQGYETELQTRPVDMDGGVAVLIEEDEDEKPPTLALVTELAYVRLTWSQARALAVAIAETEAVARRG